MGGLLGAGLGLFGNLLNYFQKKKQAHAMSVAGNKAAGLASQGYDYAQANPNIQQSMTTGKQAGGLESALLGLGGDQAAADQAFKQYQGSTGYQFRLGQGEQAATGSAALGGSLGSGATLKALQDYGQGMASQEFGRYLGELGGLQTQGLGSAFRVAGLGAQAGQAAGADYLRGAGASAPQINAPQLAAFGQSAWDAWNNPSGTSGSGSTGDASMAGGATTPGANPVGGGAPMASPVPPPNPFYTGG